MEGYYEGGAGTSLQKEDKGGRVDLEDLLLQLSIATDSLGVPVFGEQMVTIKRNTSSVYRILPRCPCTLPGSHQEG